MRNNTILSIMNNTRDISLKTGLVSCDRFFTNALEQVYLAFVGMRLDIIFHIRSSEWYWYSMNSNMNPFIYIYYSVIYALMYICWYWYIYLPEYLSVFSKMAEIVVQHFNPGQAVKIGNAPV